MDFALLFSFYAGQNMKQLFLPIAFALFAGLSLAAENPSQIEGATPEKIVGGAENLNILNDATEVTVFRVVPENKVERKMRITIDGYNCESPPQVVSGREFRKAVTAFSEVRNFGGMLMCDFDPSVILRFKADSKTLDVVVCFRCHEVCLYRDGELVRRDLKWAESKSTFFGDARVGFTAVAKKAFPHDSEIKLLKP